MTVTVPRMDLALVTGAAGGGGGVGRRVVSLLRARDLPVRAFVHRDDDRAEALRSLGGRDGGDRGARLRLARGVGEPLAVDRFADDRGEQRRVAPPALALARGALLDWSTLPVVHIRPTEFADNPFFTSLIARSVAEHGTIPLPFGTGRTAPVSAPDAARVVATVLEDPAPHVGHAYDLTGPRSQTMDGHRPGLTGTVEQLTGGPAESIETFVAAHAEWFT